MALKENYKDDILDTSQNVKRKYQMENNGDGTVSFTDVTEYTQQGDSFGASDMNAVNSEVNEVVNTLGAKNMLPNNATSQVVVGITYTINSDGSITISGTSTASNGIVLSSNQLLHKGTYKTTTGQTQEEDADAFIYVQDTNTQRVISRSNDLEVPSQFTLANDTLVNYGVWVDVGKTVNVTIYPMVRPASIADDTYAPYAQTNKELTDNLSELTKYQFGNVVDIKSYTYANPYVCPYDGYIWITSGYEASKYTNAKLNDTFVVSAVGNTGTGGITTCFVKKGMTVGIKTNSDNDCQAKFYPLA